MLGNLIAIINYNNKNYCFYQKEDNINYATVYNGELKFDIDTNDVDMLNKIYDVLRFNSKYGIFCGSYIIKGNEFEIYQDTRSTLYTFILKKNNKRYIPNEEDIILLNSYFNDEKFVYYNQNQDIAKDIINSNENKNSKTTKFVKKVLKVSGVTVVALLSSAMLTYNLPQSVKSDYDYELGRIFKTDMTQKDKSYTFKEVINAIDNNKNIPKEDKSFITEVFEAEFEENKDYIDIETIISRLEDVKIQYDPYNPNTGEYEHTNMFFLPANVTAYYNVLTNQITCLEKKSSGISTKEKKDELYGFKQVSKSTYYHEFNHLFTKYSFDSYLSHGVEQLAFLEYNDYIRTNTGIFENFTDDIQKSWNTKIFRETINEIFSQEYVDKYYQRTKDEERGLGYHNDLPYMYCLAEILPTEILREYKFNDNDSIITEGLLNINYNKNEAYKLMTSLKSIDLYHGLVMRAITNNDIDEYIEKQSFLDEEEIEKVMQAKKEKRDNYKRIHDGFAYFYKEKYNKDMSNDMNILIYLYNTPVLTEKEKQKVRDFLNIPKERKKINFEPRGYFAKDYIQSHPYVTVTYTDKEYNGITITIDDNIRYLESNTNNKTDIER